LAAATALIVYETGRRFLSPRAGLIAGVVATLNPYLIWHDVHVNREIVDQLLAAGIVYLTLLAAERTTGRIRAVAIGLGVVLGVAILSNTRLLILPLVLAAYILWQRRTWIAPALCIGACVLAVLPWAVRNDVSVGCFTLSTDTKALWKANNANTYSTLANGGWIDDVPNIPGRPPTPEMTGAIYAVHHKVIHVDEYAQQTYYRNKALSFMVDHPGEKAKLAAQAVRMFWDPRVQKTEGRPGAGGFIDRVRTWVQPVYEIPLYLLALFGLFLVPRRIAVLIVLLLGYQTVVAIGFAGDTRYRVPWDFTLSLAASVAVLWAWSWLSARRTAPRTVP